MPIRRTTILADADLLDRVERLCRRTGATKTALITTALEAYLAEHEGQPRLAFVGVGRSGHGRLSLDARSIARAELGGRTFPPGRTLPPGRTSAGGRSGGGPSRIRQPLPPDPPGA